MKKTIVMLPIESVYSHPRNLRHDVGDISELTDSISAMGILQNLTVVPYDPTDHRELTVKDPANSYVVVIGNRRLAAGAAVGLTHLPCCIESMSLAEQVATMLVENQNREDLTVYEEAQGYQMLLDLGETVESVAKRTGFCTKTVKSRIKLLELDQDKFHAAVARGGTLQDYADLDKIQDRLLKNKVLESIGTPNFQNDLKRAVTEEQGILYMKQVEKELPTFAKEIPQDANTSNLRYYCCLSWNNRPEKIRPDDADTVSYFFIRKPSYNAIWMYREKSQEQTEAESQRKLRNDTVNSRINILKEATERSRELRKEFVENLSDTKLRKVFPKIVAAIGPEILGKISSFTYNAIDKDTFASLLHLPYENKVIENKDLADAMCRRPEYGMLCMFFCMKDPGMRRFYTTVGNEHNDKYDVEYRCCDDLDMLYDFLTNILGYQMSDEERSLQNGNHPAFGNEEAAETAA